MRLGLRIQIGLMLLLLTAATVTLIGMVVLGLMRNSLLDQLVSSGHQTSELALRLLEDELLTEQPLTSVENGFAIDRVSELMTEDSWITRFELEEWVPGDEDHWWLGGEAESRDWSRLIIRRVLEREDGDRANLKLEFSTATLLTDLHTAQRLTFLFVILSAILVSIVGYLLLTRVIVAPIRRIGVATERVAAGDYASRLDIDSRNEIGSLARSFNWMLDQTEEGRQTLQEQVEALTRAKRELETAQNAIIRGEKLASVGRLAAGLAHEIGNPLSAMLGFVEHMRDDPDLEVKVRSEILERLEKELLRVHEIIRDLLDYSRTLEDRPSDADITEVFERAGRLVGAQPKFRKISLTIRVAQGVGSVLANDDRLLQVIINLLMNGADAMDGEGNIALEAISEDEGVTISVSDDGPGIPNEIIDEIFEPFFTTKEAGQGTGLGLAICDSIIDGFGGRIEVKSEPGVGSTFSLMLPRVG